MGSDLINEDWFITHSAKLLPNQVSCDIVSKNDLSILHLNARSLNFKMGQLELLLSELNCNFSFIVISETWFDNATF